MPEPDLTYGEMPDEFSGLVPEGTGMRLPLLLCLDTSASMQGEPIEALNKALVQWADELHEDETLAYTVDIGLITFGAKGVNLWRGPQSLPPNSDPFVEAHMFEPPTLVAADKTPMGEAVELMIKVIEGRKKLLRSKGRSYYRPQVCLITDGWPTDRWQHLGEVLAAQEQERKFRLYALGVGSISERGQRVLQSFAPKFNARLDGFPFHDLLQLMSASAQDAKDGATEDVFERRFQQYVGRKNHGQKPAFK